MSELATKEITLNDCLQDKNWNSDYWLCQGDNDFLTLQKRGMQEFYRQSLPIRKENWKYTRVQGLASTHFVCPDRGSDVVSHLHQSILPNSYSVVFVDGVWSAECSDLAELPEGVVICSLVEALQKHKGLVTHALKQSLENTVQAPSNDRQSSAFAALNAGMMTDGLFVYITKEVVLEKPLHFLFIHQEKEQLMHHPRHLVMLGEKAKASILEEHISEGAGCYFTNQVMQISLAKSAYCSYFNLQQDDSLAFHFSKTDVAVAEKAQFKQLTISLGAKLARDELTVKLQGDQASCQLLGVSKLQENKQHVDHQVAVEHLATNTQSQQHYRALVDNSAHAVFNGRVFVTENVEKISANQENHSILLHDLAQVDTKPELEIYSQDVECSHGVTVGCLDEAAIFYLQSRGIAREKAEKMLLFSVEQQVLQDMAITTVAEKEIMQKVKKELFQKY